MGEAAARISGNPDRIYPEDIERCACGEKAVAICCRCRRELCSTHLIERQPAIYMCPECHAKAPPPPKPESWWTYGT